MSIMYLHKSWHCPPNKSIMQNIVSTIVKADTLVRLTELKKTFTSYLTLISEMLFPVNLLA